MCTGSDSGSCSGDLCQNFELLSASSSSVNEKDNKLSENPGISENPISLMVDCIRMLKEVLFDPIPWALSVVCEEPSLLKKLSISSHFCSPHLLITLWLFLLLRS